MRDRRARCARVDLQLVTHLLVRPRSHADRHRGSQQQQRDWAEPLFAAGWGPSPDESAIQLVQGGTLFAIIRWRPSMRANSPSFSFLNGPTKPDPGLQPCAPTDSAILDAYSRAVMAVVESVGPATISLGRSNDWSLANDPQPQDSGSGVIVSTEGHALTNSHVVHGRQRLAARTAEGDTL